MDKMVKDAMNKGWALGIGTLVLNVDVDIEAARERAGERPRAEVEDVARWLPALILVSLRIMH